MGVGKVATGKRTRLVAKHSRERATCSCTVLVFSWRTVHICVGSLVLKV